MIINKGLIFHFLLFFPFFTAGQEFIYPVGSYKNNEKIIIYLMYQRNENFIELFSWDPVKKTLSRCLSSEFNPSSFSMIPDNFGFSFIDSGIIWIKYFSKKSPKPLHFLTSLYGYEQIQWIDQFSFYMSAKKNHYFTLFYGNISGICKQVVFEHDYDLLFPVCVNRALFCIARKKEQEHDSYFLAHIEKDNKSSVNFLLDLGTRPASFLHMICETEGFYVVHSDQENTFDNEYNFFSYISIKQVNGIWQQKKLFTFSVPINSILYESFFRFVPVYNSKYHGIFFTHYQNQKLLLFFFNLDSSKINLVSSENSEKHFFAPLIIDGTLFYGGTLNTQRFVERKEELEPPYMFENINADVFLEMPHKIFLDD